MSSQRRVVPSMAFVVASALAVWMGGSLPAAAQGMGSSTLEFAPGTMMIAPGGSASAKVTVKLASGTTWGTSLEADGAPKGLSVSFSPSGGDPTFTSTMTVHADASVAPGTYDVKVEATGDDPAPAAAYKITVGKS